VRIRAPLTILCLVARESVDTISATIPSPRLTLENEEWRPIPGYEGYYSASDLGRIRSEPRVIDRPGPKGVLTLRERILAQYAHKKTGYIHTALNRDNRRRPWPVHVLVMRSFVGPRPEGLEIRHLDCDKNNNTLANLKYGTPAENAQDSLRMGTNACIARTHCPRRHLLVEPNLVAALQLRGKRSCLACNRALASTWKTRERYGIEIDVTAIADAYYAEILGKSDLRGA
jgi:hypothetical protein